MGRESVKNIMLLFGGEGGILKLGGGGGGNFPPKGPEKNTA